MGKKSKRKGKRGELQAARKLGELLGIKVQRSQQYRGNTDAADLVGTGRLHAEVKRCERLSMYEALDQANSDAGEKLPIVIHRQNRKPWVAIVYLNDLVDVAREVVRIKSRQPDK